jgi:ABC-type branched-subunit amino acid transport system ATPase component
MQTSRDLRPDTAWIFDVFQGLYDSRVTTPLIGQNAKRAPQMSGCGLVLEQSQTRIEDAAPRILANACIAQPFAWRCPESVVSVS